jgi:hypothetical protein
MSDMALGALSRAWVAAEASLPLGWRLIGVWRDKDAPGNWTAVASGPHQPADMATGKDDQPEKALRRLAEGLRLGSFREFMDT